MYVSTITYLFYTPIYFEPLFPQQPLNNIWHLLASCRIEWSLSVAFGCSFVTFIADKRMPRQRSKRTKYVLKPENLDFFKI